LTFRDGLVRLYHARMDADQDGLLRAYAELEMLPPDMEDDGRTYLLTVLDQLGAIMSLCINRNPMISGRTACSTSSRLSFHN